MKRLIITIVILIQVSLLLAQETKILGTGVVFAQNDFKNINVLNSNGSVYVKINQTAGGEIKANYTQPIAHNVLLNSIKRNYPYYALEHDKYKTPLPKLSIRAFYPDESVVVFDAVKIGGGYKVYINGDWKVIKAAKGVEYQDWSSYMKRVYVSTNKKNPLYKENNMASEVISDDTKYNYKILEVKGDWIRVQCSQECEGCPDNKVLRGWIKWKDNGSIIITLSYAC